jgi:hypothetical protein
MRKFAALYGLFGITFALAHCSSESEGNVCDPGRQVECACPGDESGTQTCQSDGSRWGRCSCDDAGAGGSTGTGGSTGSGGAGAVGGGSGGSGGGSVGDGGGTCPAGTATNVTAGECDLVAQTCAPLLTCRVTEVDGGSFRTACIDLGNGQRALSEACASHAECAAGLSCVLGKCSRPCCPEHEAALCGGGSCDLQIVYGEDAAFVQVCTFAAPCTPWANDCPPGPETDCHPQDGEFKCSFPNYASDGGSTLGKPCVFLNDCEDSQYCRYATAGATAGTCRWLCKVADSGAPDAGTVGGPPGQGGCETGQTCVAFSSPSWLGFCDP